MIEVEINGDKFWENIDRYVSKYGFAFKPKECFKKHWKYIKSLGRYYTYNNKKIEYYLPVLSPLEFNEYSMDNNILLPHYVIFEFPDELEEEAFYFKMKYS